MAVERTLVQIRERTYLDILDLTLVVIRHRPLTIGATAALGIAPWALLNWFIMAGVEEMRTVGHLWAILLEAPFAMAPLTIVLGTLMFGGKPRPLRVLGTLLRHVIPMLVYQYVLRSLLLVSMVLSWLIPARLTFMNEVILLERGKWRKAWPRSSNLCRDRGGEMVGQWFTQLFFGAMFVLAFWFAMGQVSDVVGGELTWGPSDWEDGTEVGAVVGIWIALSVFTVARFLNYVDQRIRIEGWEVELRLKTVGRAMRKETDAW